MKYKSKFFSDEKAQLVGERIEHIRVKNNGITPYEYVEDAKLKRSPLRDTLEWDDKDAANKHRLWKARQIIASIVYVEDNTKNEVRVFHNIKVEYKETKERKYQSVSEILNSEELKRQVINNALKELKTWSSKYKTYKELFDIASIIDKNIGQLKLDL